LTTEVNFLVRQLTCSSILLFPNSGVVATLLGETTILGAYYIEKNLKINYMYFTQNSDRIKT